MLNKLCRFRQSDDRKETKKPSFPWRNEFEVAIKTELYDIVYLENLTEFFVPDLL